jgi:hypothetical protein
MAKSYVYKWKIWKGKDVYWVVGRDANNTREISVADGFADGAAMYASLKAYGKTFNHPAKRG